MVAQFATPGPARTGRTLPTAEAGPCQHPSAVGTRPLVIVANRLPVRRSSDGGTWVPSPGGLVSAVEPLVRDARATWVGWAGEAGAVDHEGAARLPEAVHGVRLAPVALSGEEVDGFYHGFANTTLWPLFHDAVRDPVIEPAWWEHYRRVNERYAAAVAARAPFGAAVWVHDYHLLAVPALLRALRPDVRIGFFLHIPFPPADLFRRLPWRAELVDGLLGADVVGFQDPGSAEHFTAVAHRFDATVVPSGVRAPDGRTVRVGVFPIAIDTAAWERSAALPATVAAAREVRRRLGSPRRVLLGVDRLDYTKGIDRRLSAFGRLLAEHRAHVPDTVLVQVAVPTRDEATHYAAQRNEVARLVGELNGDHGDVGSPAVHYIHRSLGAAELAALYCAADVALVTPLRDGMNLVAKEYVACRAHDDGVLVLSEFAGAAHELREALLVNPHDEAAMADAIATAAGMGDGEQRARMQAMRARIRRHDVHAWSAGFFDALEGADRR